MVMKNTLEAMPDVVMRRILKDCNYADCQSLRKSCSRLRGLVDLIKPDPMIKEITCTLSDSTVEMHLTFSDGQSANIEYGNDKGGCAIASTDEEGDIKCCQFIKNTQIVSVFGQDFQILKDSLTHQPRRLEELKISIGGDDLTVFRDTIGVTLTEQSPLLRVKQLVMVSNDPRLFTSMLPYVSRETLINLEMRASEPSDVRLNLEEIAASAHWTSLEFVGVRNFRIDDLTHFINVSCSTFRSRLSPEQAIQLKEGFQNSPEFGVCLINLENCDDLIPALRALVPDVTNEIRGACWHFRTARPEKLIRLFTTYHQLCFNIVDIAEADGDIIRE